MENVNFFSEADDAHELEAVLAEGIRIQKIRQIAKHVMLQVGAEQVYRHRSSTEDAMWWAIRDIENQNGLPEGITADDVFLEYLRYYEGE